MSFTEKIGALMHRPNDDLVAKEDVSPWLKYTGRGLGVIAGSVAIFLGLTECVFGIISLSDMMAGIWQILAAFTVLVIEAPFCCLFVDNIQDASNWADKRPYWHRAAYYILVALPPLYLDLSFSTFVGCGLIIGTGVLYGMMALGKKASREEMSTNASTIFGNNMQQFPPSHTTSNIPSRPQPNPFDSGV